MPAAAEAQPDREDPASPPRGVEVNEEGASERARGQPPLVSGASSVRQPLPFQQGPSLPRERPHASRMSELHRQKRKGCQLGRSRRRKAMA